METNVCLDDRSSPVGRRVTGASDRVTREAPLLGGSARQRGGEAGSLNRILNNTTANIIDIGMMGQTPGMPDHQVKGRGYPRR